MTEDEHKLFLEVTESLKVILYKLEMIGSLQDFKKCNWCGKFKKSCDLEPSTRNDVNYYRSIMVGDLICKYDECNDY